MSTSLSIRAARPDDASVAAILLYSAYTHTIMHYPLDEESNGFLERLEHFFRLDDNRFSYRNTIIAEMGQQVVGLILSFSGQEEPALNAALERQTPPGEAKRRLEREARDDEWYVDAIAVFEQWGHRGIGTQLLQAAEQIARQHHFTKLALNVAKENQIAFHLYQNQQFQVTGETTLYGQDYFRMEQCL